MPGSKRHVVCGVCTVVRWLKQTACLLASQTNCRSCRWSNDVSFVCIERLVVRIRKKRRVVPIHCRLRCHPCDGTTPFRLNETTSFCATENSPQLISFFFLAMIFLHNRTALSPSLNFLCRQATSPASLSSSPTGGLAGGNLSSSLLFYFTIFMRFWTISAGPCFQFLGSILHGF